MALELLLRLWQGSTELALRRSAGDPRLLLVELPLRVMREQLSILKARWITRPATNPF